MEQEALAIGLLKNLLKKEKVNDQNKAHANAVLSMAYLQLNEEENAVKPLKFAVEIEPNRINKARYLYILGQLLEKQTKLDSANIYFKEVVKFHRKIPREFYVNARLKTLLYDSLDIKNKESQIIKMIDNYENEEFLDKIYYNYSMLLFSKDSISRGKNYLNKAIRENSSDKDLLSKGYATIAKKSRPVSEEAATSDPVRPQIEAATSVPARPHKAVRKSSGCRGRAPEPKDRRRQRQRIEI